MSDKAGAEADLATARRISSNNGGQVKVHLFLRFVAHRTAVALAVLIMMMRSAGFALDPSTTEPFIIGDAKMMEDGTIVMNLRRTGDGINVSGTVKYLVNSPHYKEVLDHLGGMRPGETKLVPAWDDPVPEKK
jgi:hypothetical protein